MWTNRLWIQSAVQGQPQQVRIALGTPLFSTRGCSYPAPSAHFAGRAPAKNSTGGNKESRKAHHAHHSLDHRPHVRSAFWWLDPCLACALEGAQRQARLSDLAPLRIGASTAPWVRTRFTCTVSDPFEGGLGRIPTGTLSSSLKPGLTSSEMQFRPQGEQSRLSAVAHLHPTGPSFGIAKLAGVTSRPLILSQQPRV